MLLDTVELFVVGGSKLTKTILVETFRDAIAIRRQITIYYKKVSKLYTNCRGLPNVQFLYSRCQ